MHRRPAQHNPHSRHTRIHLRHHPRLLIRRPAHHKHHNVLRLVSRMRLLPIEERVLQFLQAALDQGLQRGFQPRGMLRVDILDTLQVEVAAELGEELRRGAAGGVEEVGETRGNAGADGGGLQAVVVREEFGDDGDARGGDVGDGGEEVEEDGEGVLRIAGVPDRVQGDEAEFVVGWDGGGLDLDLERLEVGGVVVVADEGLLELGDVEEVVGCDAARELADQADVFGHVAGELSELRVVLNEALHVADRLDLRVRLGAGLVLLDVFFDVAAQVAEVLVHVLLEEGILVL